MAWRLPQLLSIGVFRMLSDRKLYKSREALKERFFLNSYKPLCYFKQGREAIKTFGLPPFIDASCRREPDLQSQFPSISALCRIEKFVPYRRVGDSIIYMTVRDTYKPERTPHWRLTAILKVRSEEHTSELQSL